MTQIATAQDLRDMTDEALKAHVHNLKVLRQNAMKMRNAPQFGRLDRALEAAWREQDARR